MRVRKPGSRGPRGPRASARERAAKRAEKRTKVAKPAGRREAAKDRLDAFTSTAKRTGTEIVAISRELLRIPAALYMRAAEWAGGLVLAGWLRLWPYIQRGWQLVKRAFAWTEQAVTPARMTVAVALATCAALAGSQWADLAAVSVGVDAYIGLEDVAPAPDVTERTVGSAHSWVGVPIAVLAALLVLGSAMGRPKLARLLVPLGAGVIALSLLVDRPKGLDEGDSAVAYESVTAELLTGFWAQLVSGAVLILLSLVLTRVLSPGRAKPRTADGEQRSKKSRRLRLRGAEASR